MSFCKYSRNLNLTTFKLQKIIRIIINQFIIVSFVKNEFINIINNINIKD
jgi:hypothetical protein